jgi:hypothetical protein
LNHEIPEEDDPMNVTQMKRQEQTGDEQSPLPALTAAIEAEAEARTAVDTANENLQRGRAFVETAQAAVERAKALVEKARERDSRATAAAVRNRAGATPDATSTRSARAVVLEKEDNLEIAQGTIERLQDDVVQAEAALRQAVVDRLEAVNAALAPIARALVDRARDAARDLAVAKALLLALLNDLSRGAPDFSDDALAGIRAVEQITAPLAGLRAEAEAATSRNSTDEVQAAVESAVAGMESFLAQLATDASAEPPIL